MARDPILWLAATVRVLQRKVDFLEKVHAFQLNPKAPEFISRRMKDEEFAEHLMTVLHSHSTMPTKPPGVHAAPLTSSAPATTYAALSANPVEGSGPTKLPKMDPSVIELMTSMNKQLKLLPARRADMKKLNATIKNQVEIAVQDTLTEHTTEQDRKLDERYKSWEERFANMESSTTASSKGSGPVPSDNMRTIFEEDEASVASCDSCDSCDSSDYWLARDILVERGYDLNHSDEELYDEILLDPEFLARKQTRKEEMDKLEDHDDL